ncbi:LLM class flavin-dependent oxidoreductase [Spirilliplanes yamanashiensis]|uniref:FAD-binding PCMH-type domain-containing protein n=1 Tax=Spirilliplanes yamanashiensis TaxID=42233 RepID=A0A8J4DL83_9ACTN|nr:LLM class flavin-dependent oxidoreductase [Spirilliplanes yamanashiensis]MDP9817976.1 FAD/FMN-containing dehydrogenase [Spirilliplanes yamanashiensis]GIJ04785.1 hypothetical protein Sya03_41370 [Spirilliplanes yamanashiensis]
MVLQIGALLTAGAAAGLAAHAETLGYDLVAVTGAADGPDAWTALSWVAARTRRAGLVAVLPRPPRLPAVLGHAAATLDALSGGRLTVAVGGPAGELAATLDAVRGVPLWVTGDDPGSADLAGRRADGLLTPLPAAVPAALPAAASAGASAAGSAPAASAAHAAAASAAHVAAAEAAVAAGRGAVAVRRVVVVPAGAAAADVLPLAADVVLVAAGDAAGLDRFAAEVAPALRAAPAAAGAPARRRPGIDRDAVPASLTAVAPGDPDYPRVRNTYLRGGRPGIVLRASSAAAVADALAFAAAHPDLPFGVRSGGHGISGRSTNHGGIVLDVGALNAVEVLDERRRLIRVGPGARWGEVARALHPYGWALSSGDYGGVGVGGLATAGGIGWLARRHGLTIDHLRAAEVVLADGRTVRADADTHPDLFWAVRGAGGNVGVVTAFEFTADPVGDVGWARFVVGADDPAALLVAWGAAVEAAPRDVSGQLIMGPTRPGRPAYAQLMAMVDNADPDAVVAALTPLAAAGPLYDQQVVMTSYAAVMDNAAPGHHRGSGEPVTRSALVTHLTPEFAAAAAALLAGGAAHWFQIRTVGGAVADVPPDHTAYAHRSANFSVIAMGADAGRLDAAWAGLAPHVDGLYLSFDTRLDRVADAFPPATLARLRDVKRRYDPGALFRDNFSVGDR